MRRKRGAPTVILLVGVCTLMFGLIENEPMWFWIAGSAVLFALILVREDHEHLVDIRKQRDALARAQGKYERTGD